MCDLFSFTLFFKGIDRKRLKLWLIQEMIGERGKEKH